MRTVILVDDDRDYMHSLIDYFNGDRYARFLIAEPDPIGRTLYASASALCAQHPDALVLVDLYMPNLEGKMSFRAGVDMLRYILGDGSQRDQKKRFKILTAHLVSGNRDSRDGGADEECRSAVAGLEVEVIDKVVGKGRIASLIGVEAQDKAWAYQNLESLSATYPGSVLAILHQSVIGWGADVKAALEDAITRNQAELPNLDELVFFALPDPTVFDWHTRSTVGSEPCIWVRSQSKANEPVRDRE